MLNQSFSYENFRIILDVENRKGKYLEDSTAFESKDYFIESRKLTERIIEINKSIRDEWLKLPSEPDRVEEDFKRINDLEAEKVEVKQQREEKLENILKEISNKVNSEEFKVTIKKGTVKFGDQLYVAENDLENYLVLKQLQRNIYKTFNVKQSDRKKIISQLKLLLDDNLPKVIYRTDISKFYESILHQPLIDKIEENSLLSHSSKKVIKNILNQYWKILISDGRKDPSDQRIGIPRGIGISAFLSELYLKDLDKLISALPNVTYYARYVDDIIIIFSPNHRRENITALQYRAQVSKLIKKFHLQVNEEKTRIYDLRKENNKRKASKEYDITFLGYKFLIKYKITKSSKGLNYVESLPLEILMSEKKRKRYFDKIKISFDEFQGNIVKYSTSKSQTNKLLIQRIKVLANNFRLYRRKSHVLIGIYFSNEFLTKELRDLKEFDFFLESEIIRVSPHLSIDMLEKLHQISFLNGFKNKKTLNFNFNKNYKRGSVNIAKILKAWEGL